ncbi:MAG TPA: murein L,D-transpeptidase catalytic domain family protein [Caulobacteraceae bacterium]|nr:murein L,D-transpeptidase catalytic domain family protein [Caulobacteraceae bacterium]
MLIDRRRLLARAAIAAPAIAVGARLATSAARAQTPASLIERARRELVRNGQRASHHDVVGLVDFSRPSSEPRLHLVDTTTGQADSYLVAHGRGSDPTHTGWVQKFSNDFGSYATCEGAFVTGAYYSGKHGHSMRVLGLDPSNSNAEAREIVVHGAPYVGPAILRETGKLGRSEGCFAVDPALLPAVLTKLGPGRLLVSGKLV